MLRQRGCDRTPRHAGDQQLEGAEEEESGHQGREQPQWSGLCGLAIVHPAPRPLHHLQVWSGLSVEDDDDRGSAGETTSHFVLKAFAPVKREVSWQHDNKVE